MKGKFVVIEGVDGSGKTVQYNLLQERFIKENFKLKTIDFPRYYDSIWGKLVGEFLKGKFGKFNQVDPHLAVLPYIIDQYTWSRDVGKPWLEKGGVILSNRYFTSNVHQIAKLKGKARSAYRSWLWPAGYENLKLLKPDLVIFLDVPPSVSYKLNKTKLPRGYIKGKSKTDLAERDKNHQVESYKEYLFTVKNSKDWWVKISCVENGLINSPEEIHRKVWKEVQKIL